MSTILDLAIGLTLVDGISGQIKGIVQRFQTMDGVTDDLKRRLGDFKNISITGGLLAGAGVAGLTATKEVLKDCISEAAKLQTVTTDLKIVAFGNDLLDESKLPVINAQLKDLESTARNVSLDTPFNAQQIQESMSAMIKGGMTKEEVGGIDGDWENSAAKANAYFAMVNEASPIATANATAKLIAQFHWEGDERLQGLDLISKYARAAPDLSALEIQQNIGTASGTAASLWKNRSSMEVTEDTVQLMAATMYKAKDAAISATYLRNFLTEAIKTHFTEPQEEMGRQAGWLYDYQTESGTELRSIFVDYNTGMLKNATELEKIMEITSSTMDAIQFSNLADTFFGDRGKVTALALAQQGGKSDISAMKQNAQGQMSIEKQVEEYMKTAAMQMQIFDESVTTLKTTLGKPFLEIVAAGFQKLNGVLGTVITYFEEHPQVTKFMAAIVGGVSAFLAVTGTIMTFVGVIGSLKLFLPVVASAITGAFLPALGVFAAVSAAVLVIAGLAFIIYKNWNTVKPLFQSIMQHLQRLFLVLKSVFESVFDSITPALKEIFKALEEGILWFISFIVPVINTGIDMITQAVIYLSPFIRKAVELLADFIIAVIPVIKKVLSVIGKVIGAVTEVIKNFIIIGVQAVRRLLPVIQRVLSAVKKVISALTPVIQSVLSVIRKIISTATPVIKGFIAVNLQIIKALIPVIKGVFSVIGKVVSAVMPIIKGFMAINIKAVGVLLFIAQKAFSAIIQAAGILAGIIQKVVTVVKNVINAIMPVITDIFKTSLKYFKTFVGWIETAWDKLRGFLGFKKEHQTEMELPVEMTVTEIKKQETGVTAAANTQIPGIQGFDINQMSQLVSSQIQNKKTLEPDIFLYPHYQLLPPEDLKRTLEIQMQGIELAFQLPGIVKPEGLKESLEASVQEAVEAAKSITEGTDLEAAFQGMELNFGQADSTELLESLQMTGQTVSDSGLQAAIDYSSAFSSPEAKNALTTAVQAMNSVLETALVKSETMFTWGSNIVQSFINGMNAKRGLLSLTASQMAFSVADYLKVQSPSRKGELKTNPEWGGNLIQSFIDGMRQKNSLLADTAAEAALSAGRIQAAGTEPNGGTVLKSRNALLFGQQTEQREKQEKPPITIIINGAGKDEKAIAEAVAGILEERGFGERQTGIPYALTKSPYGLSGGY